MTKKNLYNWHNSGNLTYDEKNAIVKFVNDDWNNPREYYLNDLKKLYHWNNILERNKSKINIPNTIQEMRFFSAWWNNNLIIVINGDDDYGVWLLVYEMPSQQMEEILERFQISADSYNRYNLGSAESRAWNLESTLKGENPIFYNEPTGLKIYYDDNYYSSNFPSYYKDGEVKRIEINNFYSAKNNPDAYFKPLDIAKIFRERDSSTGTAPYMVHGCVYLGNKEIAHVLSNNVVEITNWDKFVSSIGSSADKIIRYHPVVAFKRPEKIVEHIAKTIEGKDEYWGLKQQDYKMLDLKNEDREIVKRANNCEHFVNRVVLGLNFSELADRRVKKWNGTEFSSGGAFDNSIRKQLNNNEALSGLTSYMPYNKISEINGFKNQSINEGIPMQEVIVTKPYYTYRLNY